MVQSYIVAALFLAFGALAFYLASRVASAINRGRPWPTTPGKVLERKVGDPMGTRTRSFLPLVKYRYTVDRREYLNDQVYLIKRTGGSYEAIQKLVNDFPDPVPVHYNPENPAESYLILNPISTSWVLVAFGALALLLGLGQLLIIWQR